MKVASPILLVEDDQVDQLMVKRAFQELNLPHRLDIARDGEEAWQYLQDQSQAKPGLIILDLNLPRLNGFDLLNHIKHEQSLQTIPVVIFTSSRESHDILESFRLGAAGYFVKPMDYPEFVRIIQIISTYWTLSELPVGRHG